MCVCEWPLEKMWKIFVECKGNLSGNVSFLAEFKSCGNIDCVYAALLCVSGRNCGKLALINIQILIRRGKSSAYDEYSKWNRDYLELIERMCVISGLELEIVTIRNPFLDVCLSDSIEWAILFGFI